MAFAWGMLAGAVLMTFVGCAPEGQQLAEKPGQAEALRIIWVDTFGQDLATIPAIDWRTSGEGGCDGGFRATDGRCCWGEMVPGTWTASVSWEGSMARSELAHELCHARSTLLTGDIDAGHQGECFLGGLANVAVGRLVAAGMGGGL